MTGRDDSTKNTSLAKSQFSLKNKAALALRAAQKKELLPSAEQNGSATSVFLALAGESHTVWITSKRRNFKYRGSLVRIGHGKVTQQADYTRLDSRKLWFTTQEIWTKSMQKPKLPELALQLVDASVRTSIARADELGIRVLNRRRER